MEIDMEIKIWSSLKSSQVPKPIVFTPTTKRVNKCKDTEEVKSSF
jgi:hypothetical protein